MGFVTFKVEGAEDIAKELAELEPKLQRKHCRKAVRDAATITQSSAILNAPVLTGRLQKSIKVRAWKRPLKGQVAVKVLADPGKSRDDASGCWYANFVDQGFIAAGNGKLSKDSRQALKESGMAKFVPGKHFMSNAYDSTKEAVAQRIVDDLVAGLEAELK
jgi:HK97 gp10 family phage protein